MKKINNLSAHKSLFILLTTVWASSFLYSQDTEVWYLDAIQQSYINPAYKIKKIIEGSVSGVQADFGSENVTLNDLITENPSGQSVLSVKPIISSLDERNLLRAQSTINTFDAALNLGGIQFSLGHAWKVRSALNYTRDLAALIAEGNAPYVGKTFEIGPDIVYQSWHEVYLGASGGTDVLRGGVRLKLLSGLQNLQSNNNQVSLYTDEEIYNIRLSIDYGLNSSGLLEYNDITDIKYRFENFSLSKVFGYNSGYAIDIGLWHRPTERLELFASAIDLGAINWSENTTRLSSNKSRELSGINIVDYFGNTQGIAYEDSLKSLLEFDKDTMEYKTSTVGKFYGGIKYQIAEKTQLGAVAFFEKYGVFNSIGLSLTAMRSLNQNISLGLSYHIRDKSFTNVGLTASMDLGLIQVFGAVTNIIGIFSPRSVNAAGFRIGGSLRI